MVKNLSNTEKKEMLELLEEANKLMTDVEFSGLKKVVSLQGAFILVKAGAYADYLINASALSGDYPVLIAVSNTSGFIYMFNR